MKRHCSVLSGQAFLAMTFSFSLLTEPVLRANPSSGQVVAGNAAISQAGSTLTIHQQSQRAIINWRDFSIAAGETTKFAQPSASAAVLNRVTGGNVSSLQGTLSANGQVWLINPNGVLVGATGVIDTAGFLASTANVADAAFLAGGDVVFSGASDAGIVNLGRVTAVDGDVVLIARRVENAGQLSAPKGAVALAGATEVLLKPSGAERVFIQPAATGGSVENSGQIAAAAAELKAAGGNEYALAINNTGAIRATGVVNEGGRILLKAATGTVRNSGVLTADAAIPGAAATGEASSATTDRAEVHVLGDRVELAGTSLIEAGGGFVDTSGASVAIADGARVDTRTADGRFGTWLIDPTDFYVTAGGGAQTTSGIGADTLSANLAMTDVILETADAGAGRGDIYVNAAVTWNAPTRLTLEAHGDIFINAPITATDAAGKLALFYGQGALASGNTANYYINAPINLQAGQNFQTKLGSSGAVLDYTVITALGAAGSTTGTDLQGIAGGLSGRYVLGADIDASATSGWNSGAGFAPIESTATAFSGTFDGLGHVITGLTINRTSTDNVGFFGVTTSASRIRNVGLVGGSVTGSTNVGALVGMNAGAITHSYATGVVSGADYVGGLVGANFGTITQSYATGATSGANYIGGLSGLNSGRITQSYATGAANGSTGGIGGLVGYNAGGGMIMQSYATGAVTGSGFRGGLLGQGSVGSSITQSYWDTGSSGQASAAGYNPGTTTNVFGIAATRYNQSAYANLGTWAETSTGSGVWIASVAGSPVWVMIEGQTRPFLYSEWSTTIRNMHQLQLMVLNLGATYTLVGDIDARSADGTTVSGMWSTAGFNPIGNSTTAFLGTFDGLGHVINGLTIDRLSDERVGLFGATSSTSQIRNVGLVGGSVWGDSYVGSLVGFSGGTITRSYATGVVGSVYGYGGGLVGFNDLTGTITQSYATGQVEGGYAPSEMGGLVGRNNGTITQSYATGAVRGGVNVGGLVGWNNGGTVSQSYATGAVTASHDDARGLVGVNDGGMITDSYWATDSSGQGTSAGGTGLTLAQLMAVLPTGFNSTVWGNAGNQTTPYLLNLGVNTVHVVNDATAGRLYQTIQSLAQLQAMNQNLAGRYALVADLDASATAGWNGGAGFAPIGDSAIGFSGTFDGLGHVINGLTIDRPTTEDVGLFGNTVGSEIRNVALVGGSVRGSSHVGSLVGFNGGTITQAYASAAVTGTSHVGGLAGWNNGTITQSYTTGTVGADEKAGGLVGLNDSGSITQSYATGAVNGSISAGGLVGWNNGTISQSYATGAVSGVFMTGNLVGTYNGSITDSTGLTLAQLMAALPTGFNSTIWGNAGNQTTPYLLNLGVNTVHIASDTANLYQTIQSVERLQAMNLNLAGRYALVTDLDASVTAGWNGGAGFNPIGNSVTAFSGTFDGLDHVITGLVINRPGSDYNGLFGFTSDSLIRNVGLVGGSVSGRYGSGALVGSNFNGMITQSYATGSVSGENSVGGLVGSNVSGTITESYATGIVNGAGAIGGLVGLNNGSIERSYATGSVSGGDNVGGLAGWNSDDAAIITQSYATGAVNGSGNGAGGLVGYNVGSTITQSYATGPVTGSLNVGGLVGFNSGNGIVTQSYATGVVNGTTNVGGLMGWKHNGTVTDSYWATDTTGQGNSDGGTGAIGLTLAELMAALPTGFDSTVWGNAGNHSTPYLLNLGVNTVHVANDATAGHLYQTIQSLAQLQAMNQNLTGRYALVTDLDASATAGWNGGAGFAPIGNNATGTDASRFSGTFDGLGHVISGLTINRPGQVYVGLFGYATSASRIRNVGWVGGSVAGSNYVGGLVGWNSGTIEQSYATGAVNGTSIVGGLAGSNEGTIRQSYATGGVTGSTGVIGGLVGQNVNGGMITQSYATGAVSASILSGGLVGNDIVGGTITDSYWATDSSGQSTSAGGTGRTLAELMTLSTFANWNIDAAGGTGAVWRIYDGFSTPLLRTFLTALEITVDDATKTYNGTAQTGNGGYTVTGAYNAGWLLGTGTVTGNGTNAGDYALTLGGLYSGQRGYDITVNAGTLTVEKAALTITADNASKTYGDIATLTGFTHGTLFGSDAIMGLTLTSDGTAGTAVVGSGSYDIAASNATGSGLSNYTITYADGTLTVTPRALTVAAISGQGKVYGDVDPALTYSITSSNLVNGDTLSGSVARATGENVNSYAITQGTLTSANNPNYAITFTLGETFAITPRAITVTAGSGSSIYGDATTNPGISLTSGSFGFSDTLASLGLGNDFAVTGATNVGSYATAVTGSSANYTITKVGGSWSVTPRAITVAANSGQEKVYGDLDPTLTYTVGGLGLANSDTLSGALTRDAGNDVDTYAITQGTLTSANNTNYTITFTPGTTLAITPRAITLAADAVSKIYGDTDAAFGVSITGGGLATGLGDTLADVTGVLTREIGENVGAYDVQLGTGAKAGNYTITFTANNDAFTITPRVITVTAGSGSSIYGDTATNPGIGLTSGSLGFSDTLASLGLGDDFAVTGTTNAGSYDVAVTGSSANYTITTVDGLWTVTPRAITVTANSGQGKVYGDTDPTFAYSITSSNLVNGDTLSGSLARDTGENVNTYAITQGSLTSANNANYAITFAPGATFAITPRAITVTAGSGSSIYGNTATNPGISLTGGSLGFTDTFASLGLGSDFAVTDATHVGNYDVAVTGSNANYTITTVDGAWTVTPRALTVTANDLAKVFGAAHVFAGTEFTADDLVNGDEITAVTLASAGADATATLAGSPYAITIGGATGTGLSNYDITYVEGALTIGNDAVASGAAFAQFQSGVASEIDSFSAPFPSGDAITFTHAAKRTIPGTLLHVSSADVQ